MNPILCRVGAYSGPGFPRPATSRIGLSSTRRQSKIQNRKIENGLFLLLLLFRSFFFASRSRCSSSSSSFALFLFLGNHFRSGGRSLCFRCNWFFLNHRRQH